MEPRQQSRLDLRQRELGDGVVSSGKALLAIVNDLLDRSRIEAGQVTPVAEEFRERPLVEGVVALVAQSALGKSVSESAELDAALPARCRSATGLLSQALLNLLGNGQKQILRVRAIAECAQTSLPALRQRQRVEVLMPS